MLKQLYALVIRDELIQRSTQFEEEAHLILLAQEAKTLKYLLWRSVFLLKW